MNKKCPDKNITEAVKLEEAAQVFFRKRRIEEAFEAYREAALLYRHGKHPQKASSCFANAAQCEKIRTGMHPLREAALMNDYAAQEAMKGNEFAQAKWLFREAGLLYEREGEFEDYSRTFVEAQDAHMRFLRDIVVRGKRQNRLHKPEETVSLGERLEAFIAWFLGGISHFVWHYGEEPLRPILVGIFIILFCAVIFTFGGPVHTGTAVRAIRFSEALYMSSTTFTTVGYGDFVPLGWVRGVSILEAFSGILLLPLFLIALTRRYLRVYR